MLMVDSQQDLKNSTKFFTEYLFPAVVLVSDLVIISNKKPHSDFSKWGLKSRFTRLWSRFNGSELYTSP
jgi:hypothetical protein